MTNLRWFACAFLVAVCSVVRADSTVVEYHHAAFDHYFITPKPDEIAILDTKVPPFQDWSRTGVTFSVYYSASARNSGGAGHCVFGKTPVSGIVYYDVATGTAHGSHRSLTGATCST